MQRIVLALALFVLVAASPDQRKGVMLRKGTPIVVQTYNAVNSSTFHSGEHMA
jgi:hypothetical protein